MNKFIGLAICFLFVSQAQANDAIQINKAPADIAVENVNKTMDASVIEKASKENDKPIETITHTIEKDIISLPDCNDEKLIAKTKEFIENHFSKITNQNVTFRRRRYFILNGLNEYTKENIANYKTEKSRPVSDLIVNLRVNGNIIEDNMLLCKNSNTNDTVGNIYLLVHPKDDGYRTYVINISKSAPVESMYFDYK